MKSRITIQILLPHRVFKRDFKTTADKVSIEEKRKNFSGGGGAWVGSRVESGVVPRDNGNIFQEEETPGEGSLSGERAIPGHVV